MRHSFKPIILIILIVIGLSAYCQNNDNKIHWLSFKEALEKNKKQPRKMIMDVYTEWCGWCKYMDKTTFTDPNIVAYINANYYAVKFDAEGNDSLIYKGKLYYNKTNTTIGGRKPSHPLAIDILHGQLSYPNLVYFDDSTNIITAIPGYKSAKDLEAFLIYFGEDLYKYVNLQPFLNDFNNTFTDSLKNKTEKVKWLTIQEAVEKSKKEKRKILVSLQTDWCLTCKIMDNSVFSNTKLSDYINKNYYPVRFNATSKDTVRFKDFTFINENKEHPFHQFAVSLLNGKMQFPNFVFIDENNNLLSAVPGYMTLESIEPIIKYFSSNAYQTQKWEEFRKIFISDLQ